MDLHAHVQYSSFLFSICTIIFPPLFNAAVRPLLIPRVTTVGASTVPLVPLSSTTRPLVPVTTSMNQAPSAPSQDFPTSTSLTETPLAASLVQSSIQTAVSSAAAVESFASQRVDSRAECQEESHDAMLITEPNFSNDQPLVRSVFYMYMYCT